MLHIVVLFVTYMFGVRNTKGNALTDLSIPKGKGRGVANMRQWMVSQLEN